MKNELLSIANDYINKNNLKKYIKDIVFTNDNNKTIPYIAGYNFIKSYLIHDSFTPIVKLITWFASPICLIILTIILSITLKNKKISFTIGLNLVLITILNQFLKFMFGRPRPIEFNIITETGYSFPSGHSTNNMAFYAFLIFLVLTISFLIFSIMGNWYRFF